MTLSQSRNDQNWPKTLKSFNLAITKKEMKNKSKNYYWGKKSIKL